MTRCELGSGAEPSGLTIEWDRDQHKVVLSWPGGDGAESQLEISLASWINCTRFVESEIAKASEACLASDNEPKSAKA